MIMRRLRANNTAHEASAVITIDTGSDKTSDDDRPPASPDSPDLEPQLSKKIVPFQNHISF